MTSVNKIVLIGRVGKDPEIKELSNNLTVASFSVATSRYSKNANGEKTEITDWHRIIFWNRQAEIVRDYVQKGSLIYIEGKLTYRNYTDKNNEEKTITEIVGESLQLLPTAKNNENGQTVETQKANNPAGNSAGTARTNAEPQEPVKPKIPPRRENNNKFNDIGIDTGSDTIPF